MKRYVCLLITVLVMQPCLNSGQQDQPTSQQQKEANKPQPKRWTMGRKIMAGTGLTIVSLITIYLGLAKKRAMEIGRANQLQDAIRAHNFDQVKHLIEVETLNPENRSVTDATAIIVAAQSPRNKPIVEYLGQERHVNVNAQDKKELAALDYAIKNGDSEMVETLIKLRALLNKPDKNQRSPLEEAVLENKPEIVTLLLTYGADPNWHSNVTSPLIYAASHDRAPMVEDLLRYSAKKDSKNYFGETALELARKYGYSDIVKLLEE